MLLFDDFRVIIVCLNHYNNNTERLIHALCDQTVPEHLRFDTTSTALPLPPSSNITNKDEKPFASNDLSILGQRSNIYDNDEFDIFNRDNIDLTRIHRGKKTQDTLADLDDKSHLIGMSERYARLGIIEDVTDEEYDDEYDDTYDDGIVNVRDKDDIIDKELEKNENRLFGKQSQHYRQQMDNEDEEENGESQAKRRDQFVENPETVRERRAQQRAAWQQRHQPHRSHTEETHNVVGSARGRGQSTTVTHNRRWKDTHKSSQANHNRRNRAAQKSNRGLLS
ncbi:unnamed protein product [Rotaria sp. Silwood2]|nr:unnamed protein product [Rotaria sp. Silwood2]CAF2636001.1 unnamed protein product [Rotaria sp. Silwood2]CAF3052337.1 unnamed protein product [Rotaria sp. Silwood2]CAF3881547.1 unnamed protein product [Rotaria sp. Silwood2]CAF3888157.1 unnamed protein product [Rotaria sp. Silwood2]